MRLTVTAVDPEQGQTADIMIEADPEAPAGELAEQLYRRLRGGSPDTPPVLYHGATPLPADQPMAAAALRSGSLLSLDAPAPEAGPEPDGVVELRGVGGADAGVVFRLSPGDYEIGSAASCRIQLRAEGLAKTAARLKVHADGTATVRAADQDGVARDGTEARDWTPWPLGGVLTVGPVLLELSAPSVPDAALQPSDDGVGLDYNRPPRLLPPPVNNRFQLPVPPGKPARNKLQLVLIFAPLMLAGVSFLFFNNPRFLIFGVLSPVVALISQFSNKRRGKESYEDQLKEYEEKKAVLEQDVDEAVLAEQHARRLAAPDPASTLLIATGPRQRLWERRWRDDDFLLMRLGVADRPAYVELQDPAEPEHRRRVDRTTHAVPVTVPLRSSGVMGVAGGAAAEPLVRWLIAQAAVLHSPSDLRICVLSGTGGAERWSWVHWLPHCAPLGEDTISLVGASAESVGRRIAEITAVIAARQQAGDRAPRGGAVGEPDLLVVLDGARRLRSLPGVIQILRDGPAVGVYALCVDDEARLLPEECRAVALAGPKWLRAEHDHADPVDEVRMDAPTRSWCVGVARALAPIRDVGDDADENLLPASARLLDVLGLEPPTPDAVAARWVITARSTRAVIGEGVDGPFAVDLAADGPHGLIAGTTGSGKSELLQSLVASLAVANRPDELNFVLVDYKGGSAFAECEDLPHTVGMVTDLDTHLVGRALVSLGAELKRREHILARAGAKDIDDYTDKRTRSTDLAPMPRLVLVIDEFASMVRELPDFVSGLVNIAQRGRSLGIHLILATQRPSGAVTADIRANTNLRIALRTTDTGESRDIIDAPDSGQLSPRTPGRAHARLGHAALLPFQTGRIGGRRPDAPAADEDRPAPVLTELHWEALGAPMPRPDTQEDAFQPITDLSVLVDAVREAATRLAVPPARRPWLPPLPDTLALTDLPTPPEEGEAPEDGRLAPVAFGLIDVPTEQTRDRLAFDLDEMGHLFVVGSPRSGRSQTLRTLAAALAGAHRCADVHLYGLDCGNGALQALGVLPHCGAVVDRGQVERVARLLNRLTAEVGRRRELLGRRGVSDLAELRRVLPEEERPPHILLLVDRFEAFERDFANYDQGSLMDAMTLLMREGASVGVHLVPAGDRILGQSRFSACTEDKLVLRCNDRADYSMVGLNARNVPEGLPAGRAVIAKDTNSAQVALVPGTGRTDATGAGQAQALAALAERVAERDADIPAERRPFRVDVLPDELDFATALARRPRNTSPLWAMIGVGGDELAAIGTDLSRVPSFVIAGPPRSGRSTVLLTMAKSLTDTGTKIVVIAPRSSPLRGLAGQPGVVEVFTDADVAVADFRAALGKVDSPAGAILVDDAEMMINSELDTDFVALARGSAGDGWGLIVAGNNEALLGGIGGWQAAVRRNRCGALLAPRLMGDGELVGTRLPRGLMGQDTEPGRAHLQLGDGRFTTVRVPATTVD
ncbi:FtsK/SpoIIIE domain-containing protein [Streptomyces sp. C11-1]|uniref:FtsK/SpoIIIE domain-containing protein n=1 Tax=Streptomyces durocortorensis TaxID=2811104 RepID=A0ABY9W5D4_9ACTN|nr:FtsK/SpoIIIE domain-containing protein [Streptomyces durocortorensis]WNF30689.1 FtsK/SpoIIIE domain-containing protein [Streptomyces durocortorensis]